MLMIAGGFDTLTRFCTAIRMPEVGPLLSEQAARTMLAPGAPALAYSTSRVASASLLLTPGLLQFFGPLGGCGNSKDRDTFTYEVFGMPNAVRKSVQSSGRYI